jgi:hypothetical protein
MSPRDARRISVLLISHRKSPTCESIDFEDLFAAAKTRSRKKEFKTSTHAMELKYPMWRWLIRKTPERSLLIMSFARVKRITALITVIITINDQNAATKYLRSGFFSMRTKIK